MRRKSMSVMVRRVRPNPDRFRIVGHGGGRRKSRRRRRRGGGGGDGGEGRRRRNKFVN